jgi:hypothetical protein
MQNEREKMRWTTGGDGGGCRNKGPFLGVSDVSTGQYYTNKKKECTVNESRRAWIMGKVVKIVILTWYGKYKTNSNRKIVRNFKIQKKKFMLQIKIHT